MRAVEDLGETLVASTRTLLADFEASLQTARADAIEHLFQQVAAERERALAGGGRAGCGARGLAGRGARGGGGLRAGGARAAGTAEAFARLAERMLPADGGDPLRPEDLRDAAVETRRAAEELNALLARTEGLLASDDLSRGLADAGAATGGLADALFLRGLALVALLLAGLALLRRLPRA